MDNRAQEVQAAKSTSINTAHPSTDRKEDQEGHISQAGKGPSTQKTSSHGETRTRRYCVNIGSTSETPI